MAYFAVVNEQGPAWVSARSMREQALWSEHAAWVNARVSEGFIVLAGPVGRGPIHRALLMVHSESEAEVQRRFAEDPWIRSGILRTLQIDPWRLLASDDRLDRVLADITHASP
jgi:uncharacterized protein YciI